MIKHLITFDINSEFNTEYFRTFGVDLCDGIYIELPFRIVKGDLLYFGDFFPYTEMTEKGFSEDILERACDESEPLIAHLVNVKINSKIVEVDFTARD